LQGKSDQPEDGPWRAETCRWEKQCKNILVTKTSNKLCLTTFYRYILWCYTTQRGCLTWKSTLSNIPE